MLVPRVERHELIAKMLLENKANVNARKGGKYGSAL
jgi:hypothetical protein